MLSAEYGGTGGKPIESFLVVEEPDIEIGAGVSSKGMFHFVSLLDCVFVTNVPIAISRRMATDQGGKRGPQSSRPYQERFRRNDRGGHADDGPPGPNNQADRDRDNSSNPNANTVQVPPAVPGFGFSFPGMPMFPTGFMLPNAQQANTSASGTPQPGQGQGQ